MIDLSWFDLLAKCLTKLKRKDFENESKRTSFIQPVLMACTRSLPKNRESCSCNITQRPIRSMLRSKHHIGKHRSCQNLSKPSCCYVLIVVNQGFTLQVSSLRQILAHFTHTLQGQAWSECGGGWGMQKFVADGGTVLGWDLMTNHGLESSLVSQVKEIAGVERVISRGNEALPSQESIGLLWRCLKCLLSNFDVMSETLG